MNYIRICSLHFAREKFYSDSRTRLLQGAVPEILNAANVGSANDDAVFSCTPISHSSLSTAEPSHLPLLSPTNSVVPSPLDTSHTPSRSLFPLFIETHDSSTSTHSSPSPFSPAIEASSPASLSFSNEKDLSLSYIDLTRRSQLTPRKIKLFKYAKKKERQLKRLQSSVGKFKMLIKATSSSKGSLSQVKDIIESSLSHNAAVLLGSQLKSAGKKPNGRRWTLEEKLLAVAIYKRSPKSYNLLRYLFTLPSRSSINKILHSIPFSPGINPQIFASLSHSLSQMEDCDRICVLMFDEMSIMEHCDYNASLDLIVGFEDYGCNRRSKCLAKYALLFMVCGVLRKWKQPIAFYFSASQTKSEMIVSLMEEVLQQCHEAGLHVIATVCDMGTNNVKAMRSMGSSITHPFINFNNQTIFTIFDPPHLIKGTRNLLMAHDFMVPIPLKESVILGMPSWSHIQDAHKHAAEATLFNPIHRITEEHVNPQGW
ncbi:hypothetical protein J437_LFUL014426 [Ladona fulva]|uniref:Transposable element P transposase-like RNase H domain-containing protein n=1 Tax=Ladona fulva TaxID=123851 RepID=A0A8K0KE66_LADFU|nr:hypothetical protein J437_LFUL014426 [Ladona fulva]